MTQLTHRTDSDLKKAVAEEISWAPNVDSTHIGVAVTDSAVTLSGEAGSFPEKHAATKAALRVRGVTAVADEITVRSSVTPANDTDVAREATQALERSLEVPAGAVKATVHEHVVTLSGNVAWQYQREAAARAVRYLRGVRNVVNTIAIRPTVSPADIGTSMTAALVRAAQTEGGTPT